MYTVSSVLQYKHAPTIGVVGIVLADSMFFSRTRPEQLPVWGLFIAFFLVGITIFMAMFYLLRLPEWYGLSLQQHRARVSLIVSGACCALLAMNSVNQLSSRDMLVLALLAVVSYFYVHYAYRSKRPTI